MRLWSLHPKYLDTKGLTALWREALLARKALKKQTKAYQNHPQLNRFKSLPLKYINTYLYHVYQESCRRNYCFDKTKIKKPLTKNKLTVTNQQLEYEFQHLKKKLKKRSPKKYQEIKSSKPKPHPLFQIKKGKIEDWEKIA